MSDHQMWCDARSVTGSLDLGRGTSAGSVRQHSLRLLASTAITSARPLSRADLAQVTGLNRSTVTRLADHLLTHGIVVEGGARRRGQGRPSVPLHPAPHTHVAIGAEIAADFLEVCVIDLTGAILFEHHHQFTHRMPDAQSVLHEITETLQRMTARLAAAGMDLVGITCGVPALISDDTGFLHRAPHLGWHNIDLPGSLDALAGGSLGVHFHNSAALAARAEQMVRLRKLEPLDDFLFVTGYSGIGSALVLRGEMQTGARGWAGQLAHVSVPGADGRCSCGSTGCLETVAAKGALMQNAGLRSDDPIDMLLAALHRGDQHAVESVARGGRALGWALSDALNLIDTPSIVVGGLFERLMPWMAPHLREVVDERVISQSWAPVNIHRAMSGQHAVSVGAGWCVLMAFLNNPDAWTPMPPGTHSLQV